MSKAATARAGAKTEHRAAEAGQEGKARARYAAPSQEELAEAYALFGLEPIEDLAASDAPADDLSDAPHVSDAELEAAFAMFAAPPETDIPAEIPAEAEAEIAAEVVEQTPQEAAPAAEPAPAPCAAEAYRAAEVAPPTPANDSAAPHRADLPKLSRRGARVPALFGVRLMQGLDWLVVALAAETAARWGLGSSLVSLTLPQAASVLAGALALKAGLWLTGAYKIKPGRARAEQGAGGLALGAIAGLGVAAVAAPHAQAAAALAAVLPAAAILLATIHASFALWLNAAHRAGAFSDRVAIIGATPAAARFAAHAHETGDAQIVAVVDDRGARAPAEIGGFALNGAVSDLLSWRSLPEVDRIVIAVTPKAETRVRQIIERLRTAPNRIDLLFDYEARDTRGKHLGKLGQAPAACITGHAHNAARAFVKRAEDIIIGTLMLTAFSPIMAIVALAVRLEGKGPVLFRQERHGFNNRVFHVLKFRTMRHDPVAASGPLKQVQAQDPRVTRIGRFLRVTSLDELPQLLNVLGGEMSLVGPRPHAVGMRAAEQALEDIAAEYAHRHRVKPGLTGWAQVNGSRGPIETPEEVRERVRLDLEYVANNSLWLDLAIMLRTGTALLGDRKATR